MTEMMRNSKHLAATHPNYENAQMKVVDAQGQPIVDDDHQCEFAYKRPLHDDHDTKGDEVEHNKHETDDGKSALEARPVDNRVDKVYTIGCFDLFHHGHVQLMKRMRELGKKVVVGVHDSRRYLTIQSV